MLGNLNGESAHSYHYGIVKKRNKNKVRRELNCDVLLSGWRILERYVFHGSVRLRHLHITNTRILAHLSHIPYKRRTSRQLIILKSLRIPLPSSAHIDRLSKANRSLIDGWTFVDVQDRLPRK